MVSRLESVTFDVADARAASSFWAALLERDVSAEVGGALVPGDQTQVGLRFVDAEGHQVGRPWLHLHLTSSSVEAQERTVATVLRLGGRHLDVGQRPEDPFVVMADPAGNELCVLEPGNTFLAGTGPLGEVTCEGTRDVGLFWRDALEWSLVWDENEETSIQSSAGGTKVSWGGPPVPPRLGSNRQRFDLVAADPEREIGRLLALGADDRNGLTDPDGNAFTLRRG